MAELPEVEVTRRALEEGCVGKKIKRSVVADDSKVIDGVSASDFEQSLAGKTIVAAHRKGKHIWLQLDSPPFPSFEFGTVGAVLIKGVTDTKYKCLAVEDDEEWPSRHSKVFVELEDGVEFSFADSCRHGKVRLQEDPTSVPPISELGPDALSEPMTEDDFVASLSNKELLMKPLLVDQSWISGIGNWVSDEALYLARIHPEQVASRLSRESCVALQKGIKEVVEKALEVGADSKKYPSHWVYHSRDSFPGLVFLDGKRVDFLTYRNRITAFVPELQKLRLQDGSDEDDGENLPDGVFDATEETGSDTSESDGVPEATEKTGRE